MRVAVHSGNARRLDRSWNCNSGKTQLPSHSYLYQSMNSSSFDEDGFAIIDDVVPAAECDAIAARLNTIGDRSAGSRCFLDREWCRDLGESLRARLADHFPFLADSVIAQCTYFHKTDAKNWLVPWHQDRSIPVERRIESEELTGWSEKEGATFVHAPDAVLAETVAVRLHLDDSTRKNGPLRVIAGSHHDGTLSQEQIANLRETETETPCIVDKGGVLVMRPLLLHASSKSTTIEPRRVLQFLLGPAQLPHGLRWRHFV